MPFFSSKPRYAVLESGESKTELKLGGYEAHAPRYMTMRMSFFSTLALLCLIGTSIASTWFLFFTGVVSPRACPAIASSPVLVSWHTSAWVCQQPSIRQEWRTFSDAQRGEYVEAVKCLATKPSKLSNSASLYDDVPWVHKHTSNESKSISLPPRQSRTRYIKQYANKSL